MDSDQLDLLTWTPPTASILAFPADRRVGKVRRTASVLIDKTHRDAERYWNQVITGMRNQLLGAQLEPCQVAEELRAFHDAVQAEMRRMAGSGRRPGGDAA